MTLRQEFNKNGFIVLRNFFSKEEVGALFDNIQRTAEGYGRPADEDTPKLNFFHNLYRRSPFVQSFCTQPKMIHIFNKLIGPSYWIRWDHAVLKKAGGEEYPWHQDNGYSGVKDPSYQFWVALTDADEKLGGLQFQKGSHKKGILPHRPFSGRHIICDTQAGEAVDVFAKAGDVVIFSSLTLHRSLPNHTSDQERWVYIVEYMPTKHFDPTIKGPYFMAARGGKARPKFVNYFRGNLSPANQLKYYRYIPAVQKLRHTGRVAIEALTGRSNG